MKIQFVPYAEIYETWISVMLHEDVVSGALFCRLLSDLRDTCRVILADGEAAGFRLTEGVSVWLYIAREMRRKGIGSRFVPYLANRILERGYSRVCLECVVGNPARKLYDRLGFKALYTERFAEKKIR